MEDNIDYVRKVIVENSNNKSEAEIIQDAETLKYINKLYKCVFFVDNKLRYFCLETRKIRLFNKLSLCSFNNR